MQKYTYATIAQLVEHQLPKLRVAGSSPVCRSNQIHSDAVREDGPYFVTSQGLQYLQKGTG